jgi:hypothetical protein
MAEQPKDWSAPRRLAATPNAGTRSNLAVCQTRKERGRAMKEAPGINPFRNDPNREKAELMAASKWAWERARFPLFADQIPAPNPDGIVAEYSRKAEDWDRVEWHFIRRAHRFRRIVARRVSTEKLTELDRLRRKLPGDPAYGADFWRRLCRAPYSPTVKKTERITVLRLNSRVSGTCRFTP